MWSTALIRHQFRLVRARKPGTWSNIHYGNQSAILRHIVFQTLKVKVSLICLTTLGVSLHERYTLVHLCHQGSVLFFIRLCNFSSCISFCNPFLLLTTLCLAYSSFFNTLSLFSSLFSSPFSLCLSFLSFLCRMPRSCLLKVLLCHYLCRPKYC